MAYSHSEPGFGGTQSPVVPYPNPYVTQPQRRDAEDAEAGEEYFFRVLVSGVFQQLLWSDPQSQSTSCTLQVMSDVAPFSRRLGVEIAFGSLVTHGSGSPAVGRAHILRY